jgi:hypothetical protein
LSINQLNHKETKTMDGNFSFCDICGDNHETHDCHRIALLRGLSGIEATVCKDIAARQKLGIAKYGVTVAESKDDMLQHAYEEALDLAVYLRAEIARRKTVQP